MASSTGRITPDGARSMPDTTPRVRSDPPRRHDRRMPAIPESTKHSLQQRLATHDLKHWPQLTSVQARSRGPAAEESAQRQDLTALQFPAHIGEGASETRLHAGGSRSTWPAR